MENEADIYYFSFIYFYLYSKKIQECVSKNWNKAQMGAPAKR